MIRKSERGVTPISKKIIRIVLTIFAIFFQVAIYFAIFYNYEELKYLNIAIRILGLLSVISIYKSNSNASYKLSWTILILLASFSGPLLFLVYGQGRTLPGRKFKKFMKYMEKKLPDDRAIDLLDGDYRKLSLLLKANTGFNVYGNTETKFLNDGAIKLDILLDELRKAKRYVFMEYFIISEGYVWDMVKTVLLEKAKEGVEIRIIYDDIGSKSVLRKKEIKQMNKQENIQMVSYNPMGVNFSLSLNYRDHRKIVVIDGNIAFVGGVNLADEYVHKKDRFGFWRDNAMVFRGDAVSGFTQLFLQMWFLSTLEVLDPVDFYGEKQLVVEDGYVFPFGDGPTVLSNPSYNLYEAMFSCAKKSIYISTPYFIIDNEFLDTLVRAISQGIDVKILVPHIPDKKTIFMMSRAHYGKILESGGEIYEYTPGFNHAKNVIIDDNIAFIGTVNVDYRSMFLHFECGSLLMNKPSIIDIKKDFLNAISESELITYEKWKKRSIFSKIAESILYLLSPLM